MKKYLAGLIAIVVAVISFAFTPAKFHEGLRCNQELYWIKVPASVGDQACNQIILNELELQNDVDLDGIPDELLLDFESNAPFGCEDEESACALGFRYNTSNPSDPTNELVREQTSPGVFQWQPKTGVGGVITSFSCCTYRPIP